MLLVNEITVLKKLKDVKILGMKEACAMTYGGECMNQQMLCNLCWIQDDVRELTRHFESKDTKMDFGKTSI